MLENQSIGDLKFCSKLLQTVHSCILQHVSRVFTESFQQVCRFDGSTKQCWHYNTLTVTFDYRNTALPQGSLLIASTHFLEHENNYFSDEQQSNLAAKQLSQLSSLSTKRPPTNNAADDLDAGTAIRIVKRMRYHDKYKRILSNPDAFTDKMSFDEVINTL
jgi:hypothetical protein